MAELHRKIMGSCWRGEQHVLGLGYSNLCSGLDVVEEEKKGKRLGERTFLPSSGPLEWIVASHVTNLKHLSKENLKENYGKKWVTEVTLVIISKRYLEFSSSNTLVYPPISSLFQAPQSITGNTSQPIYT
jgi:hypothetical protein